MLWRPLTHLAAPRAFWTRPAAGPGAAVAVLRRSFFATKAERPKDPERPKKPQGPYIRFIADYRAKHSAMPAKDILKAGGPAWKALPATERRAFEAPYEAELKQYQTAQDAYVSSGKKDAWERDPEKPKAPLSGYLRFAAEVRSRRPELKIAEQAKAAGKEWKELAEETKRLYTEKAAEEKKVYEPALTAYKASGKAAAWEERVGIADIKRKEADKKQAQVDEKKAAKDKEKDKEKAAKEKAAAKAKAAKVAAAAKTTAKKAAPKTAEAAPRMAKAAPKMARATA